MRTVFNNDELSHVWASQTQSTGRSSTGNFYFEGVTIFSYGRHFPIAKFVTGNKGEKAVLVNINDYGPTTSNHKSLVRKAIPGNIQQFKVYLSADRDLSFENPRHCEQYRSRIAKLYEDAIKNPIMKRAERLNTMLRIQKEAVAYAAFFGLKKEKFPLPASESEIQDLINGSTEHLKKLKANLTESQKSAQLKAEKLAKARAKEQAKLDAVKVQEWKDGLISNYSLPGRVTEVALRIEGDEIATSKGARVPILDGLKIIKLAEKCQAEKLEFYPPADFDRGIGRYNLDRIDSNGDVHAGCHHIKFDEIKRLSSLLTEELLTSLQLQH
jgi:hypothetical protein